MKAVRQRKTILELYWPAPRLQGTRCIFSRMPPGCRWSLPEISPLRARWQRGPGAVTV